jgi:hypothetical protein
VVGRGLVKAICHPVNGQYREGGLETLGRRGGAGANELRLVAVNDMHVILGAEFLAAWHNFCRHGQLQFTFHRKQWGHRVLSSMSDHGDRACMT